MAEMRLQDGYVFADGNDTRKLLEAAQNLTDGSELGLVGPRDLRYFVVFEFESVGYVKDDEKSSLDADAIMAKLKEGNDRANEEKKKGEVGIQRQSMDGNIPPRYNEETTIWNGH